MPELPEATTIARGLSAALVGAQIKGVRLLRADFLKCGRRRDLRRLRGTWVDDVTRRGKWVILHLDGRRLVLQLGLAGRILVQWADEPPPAHTHLVVALEDGREMRYANSRRIAGGVALLEGARSPLLDRLGPDADAIAQEEFIARLAGRKTPVKAALMNQAILAGVGNIYSDEALFRAGIRPTRPVRGIRRSRLARLHRCLRGVLAEAIAAGGSTLPGANPYAGTGGEIGYFTQRHRVYGRHGRPCLRCRTVLRRVLIGGRSCTFCPRCQK
jgi:formamidopyrimidine-DNA glycosylase